VAPRTAAAVLQRVNQGRWGRSPGFRLEH
jgi:hypothetical protein